ncbi:NADP-dependent oxidoreductase domain-containing protein [Aspergillus navahoensis]
MALTSIPTIELKEGTSIPVIGYGTGTAWFKTKGDSSVNCELAQLTKTAIRLGYHQLDSPSYLFHQPFFAKSPTELQAAWAAMEESQLEPISQSAKIPPAINQIEYHSYLQQGSLVPYHEKKEIATTSYGPLTPATRAKSGPLDRRYSSRWSLDRGTVAITTSAKESRLSVYLNVLTFKLTPEEVDEISRIGDQKHYRGFWSDKFAADDRS